MNTAQKTYSDLLYEMIRTVATRVSYEVPDSGMVAPVTESFHNQNPNIPIERYVLSIVSFPSVDVDDKKQCYIEATVIHSSGSYKADMLLLGGHKEFIVKELLSDDFPQKLNCAYIDLIYELLNP